MRKLLLAVILFYRYWISPLLPPVCRFNPSCSEYAREAIQKYGAYKGLLLTCKRLCCCHPYHDGGHDPVP